ncbi:MAG: ABC transporter permease, partial [Gemmataceae bacterium]|nr:ABC transporter permease [Gemmataceae bacterium]
KHVVQYRAPIRMKSLTRYDPASGGYTDAADELRVVNLLLPAALIGLMFMVIMIGATPAMHGIIEEKSQRIAEVLLGSVTPFQLMAGKVLGVIGVSLTMALVYLGGGYVVLVYYGFAELVPLSMLLWFVPMLLLALLIFGSLFIAVGAAATDVKDTQTLLMPIMLFACLPFFAMGPIMQDPNGPIARVCSFFPFATPMLLVARESVPPGVPWPEMVAGIMVVLATAWLCVWAASRIFRIGILMQGKGPKFSDLIRWAIKG